MMSLTVPDLLSNNVSTMIVDGQEVIVRKRPPDEEKDAESENKLSGVKRFSRSLQSSFRKRNWKNSFLRPKSLDDYFKPKHHGQKKGGLGRPSSLKIIANMLPIPSHEKARLARRSRFQDFQRNNGDANAKNEL